MYFPAGGKNYTLNSSISSTETTIPLVSFVEPVSGVPYTMALLNTDIVYGTIAPRTTSSEFISFTGITQNPDGSATLTGVTRGLSKKYPFTASAAFRLPHAGQSTFIMSDAPQVFNEYSVIENDETITGKKAFPAGGNANAPVSGTVYSAPVADIEYASKKYVDDTAVSGAPDANTTTKGLVQLPTQAQTDARTSTGSTGASLTPTPANLRTVLTHDLVASAVGTDSYAITVTPAAAAYSQGQVFRFKADVANTGACTLNVSGLGAVALKAYGQDPRNSYIVANSTVEVVYNSTGPRFDIQSVSAQSQVSQDGLEVYGASATGNDTYAIAVPTLTGYTVGQVFRVKADVANAGAASLNVNAIGALSILRPDGSALANGDIAANQIFEVVVYDASTVKLLSPVANSPLYNSGTTTRADNAASGSQNIAHGLGRVPRKLRIAARYVNTLNGDVWCNSDGTYIGTATATIYTANKNGAGEGGNSSSNIINLPGVSGGAQSATVTLDATNINLTWTRTGSGITTDGVDIQALWEVEA